MLNVLKSRKSKNSYKVKKNMKIFLQFSILIDPGHSSFA